MRKLYTVKFMAGGVEVEEKLFAKDESELLELAKNTTFGVLWGVEGLTVVESEDAEDEIIEPIEPKEKVLTERTYKNTTSQHQLIGNCEDVIFTGSEKDCWAELDKIDIEDSKWGVVRLLAPNEETSGKFYK